MNDLAFTYSCTYCGKGYKRKGCYDKHVITCELIHENSKFHKKKGVDLSKIEEDEIPSREKMFEMFQAMVIRCNNLENKVAEMQKYIGNKKKKINVISWLNDPNEENKAIKDFDSWCTNITITEKHLELVFHTNLQNAIFNILVKNCFYNNEDAEDVLDGSGEGSSPCIEIPEDAIVSRNNPIRAFTFKKTFYIYVKNEKSKDELAFKWREIRHNEFVRLCDFYYNKLCELQSAYLNDVIQRNPIAIADDAVIHNSKKMFDPMSADQKNRTISAIKNKFYDRIKGSLPSYVCSIEDT